MPHCARHGVHGCSLTRSTPELSALGGQVIGSMAIDCLRRAGSLSASPVKTMSHVYWSSTHKRTSSTAFIAGEHGNSSRLARGSQLTVGSVELQRANLARLAKIEGRATQWLRTDRQCTVIGDQSFGRRYLQRECIDLLTEREVRVKAEPKRGHLVRLVLDLRRDGEPLIVERVRDADVQPPRIGRLRLEGAREFNMTVRLRDRLPRHPPDEPVNGVVALGLVQRRASGPATEGVRTIGKAIRPRCKHLSVAAGDSSFSSKGSMTSAPFTV